MKEPLTKREHEVMVLMALGKLDKEIGYALGVTPGTAGNYACRVLRKLGIRSRHLLFVHLVGEPEVRRLCATIQGELP